MPQDCPLLIQPLRPTPPAPSPLPPAPRKVFTKESFLTPPMEEQKRQHEEYYRLAALPASRYLAEFSSSAITEVVEGKAWVVPSLLSPQVSFLLPLAFCLLFHLLPPAISSGVPGGDQKRRGARNDRIQGL